MQNLENQLPEIKMEILLQMEYVDMLEACIINKEFNKICHEDALWHRMIKRDFPFYPSNGKMARKSYEYWYHVFDDFTLLTVTKLIIYRTKKNNVEKVYQDVFNILVDYINQTKSMTFEGTEERKNKENQLDLEIFTKIFTVLDVPFKFDPSFYTLVPRELFDNTDQNKWQFLNKISIRLIIECFI